MFIFECLCLCVCECLCLSVCLSVCLCGSIVYVCVFEYVGVCVSVYVCVCLYGNLEFWYSGILLKCDTSVETLVYDAAEVVGRVGSVDLTAYYGPDCRSEHNEVALV